MISIESGQGARVIIYKGLMTSRFLSWHQTQFNNILYTNHQDTQTDHIIRFHATYHSQFSFGITRTRSAQPAINMQFTNLIILSLGAVVSVNAVDCWKSGPTVKVGDIAPSIPSICDYFSGIYQKDENRYQCITDAAGVKWDFALTVSRALITVWRSWELTRHSSSVMWSQGK